MLEKKTHQLSKKKLNFKTLFEIVKTAIKGFNDDDVLKLSASLAYATVFSIAPMLLIIITVAGIFYNQEAISGQLYNIISEYVDGNTAKTIQDIVQNSALNSNSNTLKLIVGGLTLAFGATAVFAQIQSSINYIWGIKPKPKRGWLKMLRNRLMSFSLIISLGFLFLVTFMVNTVINAMSSRFFARYETVNYLVVNASNWLVSVIVICVLFMAMFKLLPDAKMKWRDVFAGAFITTLLFLIGRQAISYYLATTAFNETFGAAASVILILTWVYYSAIILYLGAEFTLAWAVTFGRNIEPNQYAVLTELIEVESESGAVQANNKTILKEGAHSTLPSASQRKSG